jgi:secreted trypsin-like serine protease
MGHEKFVIFLFLLFHYFECAPPKSIDPSDADDNCGLNYKMTNGGDRIIGGRDAEVDEWPWMVSLQRFDTQKYVWVHFCGGSLINSRTILTAAHCSRSGGGLRAVAGCHTAGLENEAASYCQIAPYTPAEFVRIPEADDFDNENVSMTINDVAVIRLKNVQFRFSNHPSVGAVGAVCLPKPCPNPRPGKTVLTSGWGQTFVPTLDANGQPDAYKHNDRLKTVVTEILPPDVCSKPLNKRIDSAKIVDAAIRNGICTYSKENGNGVCIGDSGGPAVMMHGGRYFIVGIAAFTFPCGHGYNYPDYYTRVDKFLPWIRQMMHRD